MAFHVEFDTDATVYILTELMNIPWWKQFRKAADSDSQAHQFLDGSSMIVTGLCVWISHTRLQPKTIRPELSLYTQTKTLTTTRGLSSFATGVTKAFAAKISTTFTILTINTPFGSLGHRVQHPAS
jgi:hypothetical protein